jgi:hypothetical protein
MEERKPGSLLVVDDEAKFLKALTESLAARGFEVISAASVPSRKLAAPAREAEHSQLRSTGQMLAQELQGVRILREDHRLRIPGGADAPQMLHQHPSLRLRCSAHQRTSVAQQRLDRGPLFEAQSLALELCRFFEIYCFVRSLVVGHVLVGGGRDAARAAQSIATSLERCRKRLEAARQASTVRAKPRPGTMLRYAAALLRPCSIQCRMASGHSSSPLGQARAPASTKH